ncbi:DUF4177 domain-containing protein [Psychrobacillus sp. L4]|uniref:DUF4177 domain-containing protein n=1 Tax=Psychrobacillus sp. L4 TaxID=3236892 RepID=UPI0036F210A2
MFKYEFVNIKVDWNGNPKENPEEIIKKYAQEEWRLHTFAPLSSTTGGTTDIKLIFEKKVIE